MPIRDDAEEYDRLNKTPIEQQKPDLSDEEQALRAYWETSDKQDRLRVEQQKLGRRCPFGGRMYGLDSNNTNNRRKP